jgi:hypothetical protein
MTVGLALRANPQAPFERSSDSIPPNVTTGQYPVHTKHAEKCSRATCSEEFVGFAPVVEAAVAGIPAEHATDVPWKRFACRLAAAELRGKAPIDSPKLTEREIGKHYATLQELILYEPGCDAR